MSDNPASHFGRQVRKERVLRGWTLPDLAEMTGIDNGHWSRIENGKRPPTEKIARAADRAFPERKGWFYEYWGDLQRWSEVPTWFKPWSEHELSSRTIRSWSPQTVNGLLQTEAYARAQTALYPGITPERLDEWVSNRMARQRRVLYREDPPDAHFLVDISSLRRMPTTVKHGQLRHLIKVARLPYVTIQVVPECWHGGTSGGFVLTDAAAYSESVTTGQVYGGPDETVRILAARFDNIRKEAMRVSDTLVLLQEMSSRERLAQIELFKRQRRRMRRSVQQRAGHGP